VYAVVIQDRKCFRDLGSDTGLESPIESKTIVCRMLRTKDKLYVAEHYVSAIFAPRRRRNEKDKVYLLVKLVNHRLKAKASGLETSLFYCNFLFIFIVHVLFSKKCNGFIQ
jgi:hypothetical protein